MGEVINLFSKKNSDKERSSEKNPKANKIPDKNTDIQESFEEAIAKNEANAKRMKEARIKDTKKVLREYKIKN